MPGIGQIACAHESEGVASLQSGISAISLSAFFTVLHLPFRE